MRTAFLQNFKTACLLAGPVTITSIKWLRFLLYRRYFGSSVSLFYRLRLFLILFMTFFTMPGSLLLQSCHVTFPCLLSPCQCRPVASFRPRPRPRPAGRSCDCVCNKMLKCSAILVCYRYKQMHEQMLTMPSHLPPVLQPYRDIYNAMYKVLSVYQFPQFIASSRLGRICHAYAMNVRAACSAVCVLCPFVSVTKFRVHSALLQQTKLFQ